MVTPYFTAAMVLLRSHQDVWIYQVAAEEHKAALLLCGNVKHPIPCKYLVFCRSLEKKLRWMWIDSSVDGKLELTGAGLGCAICRHGA